jgi:hypothetical protein
MKNKNFSHELTALLIRHCGPEHYPREDFPNSSDMQRYIGELPVRRRNGIPT